MMDAGRLRLVTELWKGGKCEVRVVRELVRAGGDEEVKYVKALWAKADEESKGVRGGGGEGEEEKSEEERYQDAEPKQEPDGDTTRTSKKDKEEPSSWDGVASTKQKSKEGRKVPGSLSRGGVVHSTVSRADPSPVLPETPSFS